ncbi:RNA polymerase sigma factor [Sphingomonas gilva]|uniref:RNA polymerase sigma factor n=1 Tax=Sphingomonas gilva TaxID=2305907 RepID=UPI001FE6D6BE|nr:sigma-70 family RNA polymerase sigma factor [Sphingomonas gilva]
MSYRWRPALMAFFLRRVDSRAEAEDLTQEVLLRMLDCDLPAGEPDSYIFRIAQNLLIDRARKTMVRDRYRQRVAHEPERMLDPLDPHRIAASREQLAAFAAALAELPERTRTMFILFRLENLSQETIGAAYGISASAVKQQIGKAMATLSGKMRDLR